MPGDRSRVLLPLAFCRECGQEYYTVYQHTDPKTGAVRYLPRPLNEQSGDDHQQSGFLYASEEAPWPEDANAPEVVERLPEDWCALTPLAIRPVQHDNARPLADRPVQHDNAKSSPCHAERVDQAACEQRSVVLRPAIVAGGAVSEASRRPGQQGDASLASAAAARSSMPAAPTRCPLAWAMPSAM